MGLMKRLAEKSRLSKEEKEFVKRSQEDRRHFPLKKDEKKK